MNAHAGRHPAPWRSIVKPWFALTVLEQKAVALVLSLFLLGVAVRYWRSCHRAEQPAPPPALKEK